MSKGRSLYNQKHCCTMAHNHRQTSCWSAAAGAGRRKSCANWLRRRRGIQAERARWSPLITTPLTTAHLQPAGCHTMAVPVTQIRALCHKHRLSVTSVCVLSVHHSLLFPPSPAIAILRYQRQGHREITVWVGKSCPASQQLCIITLM